MKENFREKRYCLTESGERVYLTDEEIAEEDRLQGRAEAIRGREAVFMAGLNAEMLALNADSRALRDRVLARATGATDRRGSGRGEGMT